MIPFANARLRRTLLVTAALVIFGGSSTFNPAAATNLAPQPTTFVRTATMTTMLGAHDVIRGPLAASQSIHVSISLKLRNQPQLDAFLAKAGRADTPAAQRTMPAAQFAAQFSPTAAQANAVAQYLSDTGFTNVHIAPNRMLVSADGPTSVVQSAFHTSLAHVQTADGRQAFANTEAVQIPAALQDSVLAVLGLQTVHQHHITGGHAVPMSVSGHNPTEFSAIYGGNGVTTGAGITVGIITQGDISAVLDDLQQFTSQNGLADVPTQTINTNGSSGDTAGVGEWDLDSQDIVGMAGGEIGKIIFYNIPTLSNANLTADFNTAVSDNQAKIINVSLGECETAAQQDGSAATDDQIFQQGITQGQTFSVSTGDSGADECGDGGTTPSDPASSPYVVAVAGTLLNASTSTWNSEVVWNELSKGEGATGGSESTFQPKPSWQTLWTGSYRGVADVAFDGDPESGSQVIVNGSIQQIGGTSLAAPLFAGLWARMLAAHGTSLGFAGPHIYQLPAADFHDVTSGNNDGETAKVGYDLASGRGSMIMSKVVADLAGGSGGSNTPPVAAFNDSVNGLQASFTDQSSDSDGSIATRAWDFGDGHTSSATNPSHSYASAGTYSVQLTVTDNDGDSDSVTHSVSMQAANQAPVADFSVTNNGLVASFTDQSSDSDGSIAARAWDFGDGNTSSATNPSHSYASAGTYSVQLTVTDNDGTSDSTTHSVTVSVSNQAPTADFSVTTNGLAATFSDASSDSDGNIAARAWDFGDGHTSSATNPSHTYASAGSYSVQLTVTDNDGASDSVTHSVSVSDNTPPPGTPVAAVAPASLSFSVEAGNSGSNALSISNIGAGTLTFTIAEGPHSDAMPTSYKTALQRKSLSGASVATFAPASLSRTTHGGSNVHGLSVVLDTATMISQMADNSPGTEGVACSSSYATDDNSWWRRFDFSEFSTVGTSANITSVTISSGNGSANGVPVTINLYTINHHVTADSIPTADLTLIGSGTGSIDSGLVSVTIPVNATVADTVGKDLVVEYHTEGSNNGKFEPGANASTETHPSYISSTACGISEPETGASIGFPDFHLTMVVNLDSSTAPAVCQNVQDIPWLSESPSSGSVAGGNSTNVSVSADASGLNAGNYSADVCVSTNDATQPVIAVPVSLAVTPSTCAIIANDDLFNSGFEGKASVNTSTYCGPPPSGNIVLSGPLNWHIAATSDGDSIDFLLGTDYGYDANYVDDLNLYASNGSLYSYWFGDKVSAAVGGVVDSNGDFKVLQSGAVIGSGSSLSSNSIELNKWVGGKTGYLGIAFYNENTGAVDYGYVHLKTTGPKGFPATVLDYAYDADGNAITIP